MNEVQHTPGPWKAVPTAFGPIDIVIPDGRDIVTVYGGGTGNKEGNARLIAAAPEMLEALDHIGGLSRYLRQGGPDPMDLQELSDALEEAVDMANELVRKATGAA